MHLHKATIVTWNGIVVRDDQRGSLRTNVGHIIARALSAVCVPNYPCLDSSSKSLDLLTIKSKITHRKITSQEKYTEM